LQNICKIIGKSKNHEFCFQIRCGPRGHLGIIGIILGIHGVAMPCNRYAYAIVTGCAPGSNFGNFRFNISYVDKNKRLSNQRGHLCEPGRRVGVVGDRTPSKSDDEIEKEFIIPMGIVKSSNLKQHAPPTL
jgi:hypothetical protein